MLATDKLWAILAIFCHVYDTNGQVLQPVDGDIRIQGDIINNDINGTLARNINYNYKFRGEPDRSMNLDCEMIAQFNPGSQGGCRQFRLRASSGDRFDFSCGTRKFFYLFSEDETMDVLISTGDEFRSGSVNCRVKSIRKIVYSNYKNIASEEFDSSELANKQEAGPKNTTCDCGWTNKAVKRILFGEDAGKHEFPWAASLQYKSSNFHFCGGSIISPYHVITATHCLKNKVADNIVVVVGSNNNSDTRLSFNVKKFHNNNYGEKPYIKDISILELASKITYNDSIGPICIPTTNPSIDFQYVTAMGWGTMDESEKNVRNAAIMKKTHLRVVDIGSCSIDWHNLLEVDDPKFVCTYSNHTNICNGDSGGPVVWYDAEINRYTLVGLPALVEGDCKFKLPACHTAVGRYYDWIISTISSSDQAEAKKSAVCTKID